MDGDTLAWFEKPIFSLGPAYGISFYYSMESLEVIYYYEILHYLQLFQNKTGVRSLGDVRNETKLTLQPLKLKIMIYILIKSRSLLN